MVCLDLLILKALAREPQHGWAISERLRAWSSAAVQIRQGSLYLALHRLDRRGATVFLPYAAFQDYASAGRSFTGIAVSLPMEPDIDIDGGSEFAAAEVISASYGELFGVRPAVGQWFTSETEPSAVISYAVWTRRFNRDPRAIGAKIQSESQLYTVVVVAPPEFAGVFAPLRTDLWVPLRTRPSVVAALSNRSRLQLMIFGRLRPGITTAQAAADLNAVDSNTTSADGSAARATSPLTVEDLRGVANPSMRRAGEAAAFLLMFVAGVVLAIACVNVGNLFLVRGAVGAHEVAIRRARREPRPDRSTAVERNARGRHVQRGGQRGSRRRDEPHAGDPAAPRAEHVRGAAASGARRSRAGVCDSDIGDDRARVRSPTRMAKLATWRAYASRRSNPVVSAAARCRRAGDHVAGPSAGRRHLCTDAPRVAVHRPGLRGIVSLQAGARAPDWTTHLAVDLLWIGVGLVACLIPALHATAVNPAVVLREE